MASPQSPSDEGMRRRHSNQHEGSEPLVSIGPRDHQTGANTLDSSDHAAQSRSIGQHRSSSSGNDAPLAPPRSPEESDSRVRFSSDIERRASVIMGKKRKSDEIEESIDKQDGRDSRGLRVDTAASRASASNAHGGLGGNPIRSPDRLRSPLSPTGGPSKKFSPLSPRNRTRGLSLRSSLFTKNIHQQPQTGESSNMEMQDVVSTYKNARPQTEKGKSRPEVTVSSIAEEDYTLPGPAVRSKPSRKGMLGMSALPNYQEWSQGLAATPLPLQRVDELIEKARKFILRIQDIPPSKDGRHVPLDPSRKQALLDDRTARAHIGNVIRSSKYNAWNFVPRQLFAQFSKLANFYFLCVSILQMIPGLSTTGTYTTIVPLLFFVSVSMAKEGYEDYRRFKLDKEENNREAHVLHAYVPIEDLKAADFESGTSNDGILHWVPIKWQNLQVGDVVRLSRDEAAPADLVLLHSEHPNGVAYIETMALDGETNLKRKQAASSVAKACSNLVGLSTCGAHFVLEDPNLDLYNFEGKVTLDGKTAPLTNNEIIYRGSVLRNTSEAMGMVIYSGEECKIRMNANKNPRIKAPTLQSIVNKIVVLIVIFVVALSMFCAVAYLIWQDFEERTWYLTNARIAFGPVVTSFIIMFHTLIPLSLYVSLEIIKLAQMFLLNDIDMYDEASNTPFEARTSTINEELGQVSYIFSDKTGTLTENVMKFRKLSVAGTAWLHDVDLKGSQVAEEEMLTHKKRKQKQKGKSPLRRSIASANYAAGRRSTAATGQDGEQHDDTAELPRTSTSQWNPSARPTRAQPELNTMEMIRYIQHRPHTVFATKAKMLILSMALCHTCLPERSDNGDITFQAASPDELALVRAAQELGYLAYERDSTRLTIKTFPKGPTAEPMMEVYDVLDVIEFSSKRKRMSVVVRFPDGRICVMCKGADSVIMQKLRLATWANQKAVEIEKRVSQRKSMEAHQVILRKSSQIERSGSIASAGRTSFSVISPTMPRLSTTSRLAPIRDEVDSWLRERERDIEFDALSGNSVYYSPRPSAQFSGRPSLAVTEHRNSAHYQYEDEDLVEESMASDDAAVIERCLQHINDFATEGLRTLLYAHRFLDEADYQAWKKIYHDATTSLVNRQELIEEAGDLVEQELELGGATAIEDKLQNGVPDTIERLRRANIKMWMLTGDKRETAINIGHSCRLIKDYSSVTVLDHEAGKVEKSIAAAVADIQRAAVAHSVVVIDGQTLAIITLDERLNGLFLDLAVLVDSVLCCRASPSQKAGLVNAIRKRVNRSVTLAIGDGANDIAMIQEAHIGIGITGKEGLQAARTSDYSIAQFRFLVKLLLVHGRWNYVRICKYTVGTFWKEMLFYTTQALYQRWAGYTGTSLYESWSLSMFNTLFTSLPVIFLGIFEKDLLPATLIAAPELYTRGQRGAGFNFKVYIGWMFMAACEALIVYFTMFGLFGRVIFTLDNGLFAMGDMTFSAVVIIIFTKLQVLEMHNHSIMAAIAGVLSVGGWFLWNISLSALYKDNSIYNVKDGFFDRFGRNALWWLTLILICASCILFEIAVRSLKAAYLPTDVEIFQALEKDLGVRKRFEEASAAWMQAGWQHGSKKSSLEVRRDEELQAKREREISELLARPRTMEEGMGKGGGVQHEEEVVVVADGSGMDIQEVLSRRFGNVRRE